MFDRFVFSLSMFFYRLLGGFSNAGVSTATTSADDEPFYIHHQARYQDYHDGPA